MRRFDMRHLALLVGLAFGVLPTLPSASRAQTPDTSSTFPIDAWEPGALPGTDLLNLARSRVPGHLVPGLSLQLGYVRELLELAADDDPREVDALLVDARVRADVVIAFGLFDRLALSVLVPTTLDQSGGDLALLGRPGERVSGFALGDLRLALRGNLFEAGGVGMALGVELHLPTGDAAAFQSYDGVRLRPQLILDWHAKSGLGLVLNVGWRFVPETRAHNLVLDDGIDWGVGLDLPTPLTALHVVASVFGTVPLSTGRDPADPDDDRDDDRNRPAELAAAFRLLTGDFSIDLGGGAGLSRGVGAPAWRAFAELAWSPRPPVVRDNDGDGLPNTRDVCPDAPEDADGHQDADGCPEPDNDGDGVPDLDDGSPDPTGFGSCRDAPEDVDGFFDTDGCPEPDNDADGRPDGVDGPVDASGFGACRDQAEDLDGHQDDDGCPEPDNDGDGVPDVADGPLDKAGFGACRDAPETVNGYRDDDGCPDEAPKAVRVTQFKIEILDKVFFQYDKAIIKPESFGLLDEVARVLVEAPELTKIQVEGHTDDQGSDDYNLDLSQRRAESVVSYLVAQGVDPLRLVAKGYGKSRPLVTGPAARRPAGRALNRRVEFVITEVNGQPHSPKTPAVIDRPVIPK